MADEPVRAGTRRRRGAPPLEHLGGWLLAVLYGAALLAPFLAPYAENDIDRGRFYHPPTPLHWREPGGGWRLRPFVYGTRLVDARGPVYAEDRSRRIPVRAFVRGAPWRIAGVIRSNVHLFGVEAPERIFLLGADPLGRDELTRLLFGAQVSLGVGLVGIAISFTLGLLLGGIAGYFGGWLDALIMRTGELLLSVPTIYLVVALRGVFPIALPSRNVYVAIVAVLAIAGWAVMARVIRGMVLSIRQADYVAAAEALGLGRARIIVRHILPNTMSFVVVAATVAVPGYILGEVVLSFLGMGVQEPSASWGNMLQQSRNLDALANCPWMLWGPAGAIFLTVTAFNLFGDGLRDALDPRRRGEGTA